MTSSVESDPLLLAPTINDESSSKFTLNWSAGSQIKFDPGSNQVSDRDFSSTIIPETISEVVKQQKSLKWSKKSSLAGKSSLVKMSKAKKKLDLRKASAQKSALRLKLGNSYVYFTYFKFVGCVCFKYGSKFWAVLAAACHW